MSYEIQDFEYQQDLFNLMAGTANKTDRNDLLDQLNLINEEASEISDGLRKKDSVEVLDGAIDTLFVVLGFIQKLKMKGYVTYEAMQRVAENNLSKFPKDFEIVAKTIKHYKSQGIDCHYEYLEDYGRYVIRDSNNKVRKPIDFVPVDLSDCVPNGEL
jgi:NTP pyrophosphatase (non-canonical NTP hydrolase)